MSLPLESELNKEWRAAVGKKLDSLEENIEIVKTAVIRMEAEKLSEVIKNHEQRILVLERNWIRLFTIWITLQSVALCMWALYQRL
jgi:hypothetical protein